jgi:enterochelin esterase-like enzyme
MGLLGRPLLVLLVVLTVVAPLATYLLWGRVPRAGRVVVRCGLLVTCQLCAVLLVGVVANDYGYFYTSWAELFGAAGSSTSAGGAVATPTVPADPPVPSSEVPGVRVLRDTGWSSPDQWRTRGRLVSVDLRGVRSGLGEHAYVYLPPQYFFAAARHVPLPGVEVMTGYPGHEQALVTRMHYPDVELAAIDAHRARPAVLVLLRPSVTEPWDTECTDVPNGPQALTFFSQDVPADVEAQWRVRPVGWGVMGDSTGGYCATKIALMRSDVFTAAVSFSGYYHAVRDRTTGDLWGGSTVLRDLNDPLWRLRHLPEPPIGLFATIARGEGGAEGYADTMRLQRAVAAAHGPLQLRTVVVAVGGHSFASWSTVMPQAFSWLSSRLGTAA